MLWALRRLWNRRDEIEFGQKSVSVTVADAPGAADRVKSRLEEVVWRKSDVGAFGKLITQGDGEDRQESKGSGSEQEVHGENSF
jgi:hypothetical protein